MHEDSWQAFSDRVTFEDELHVDCAPLTAPLSDLQYGALRERNLNVLNTLLVFGERRAEAVDEDSAVGQEMQRLDSKLNVLMAMMDQLLRRNTELPSRRLVRFNAHGALLPRMIWPVGAERALLRLHIDGCLALPLELPARLMQERDSDHIFVAFETLDEVTRDALERLVFRHHRRKVAGQRLTSA